LQYGTGAARRVSDGEPPDTLSRVVHDEMIPGLRQDDPADFREIRAFVDRACPRDEPELSSRSGELLPEQGRVVRTILEPPAVDCSDLRARLRRDPHCVRAHLVLIEERLVGALDRHRLPSGTPRDPAPARKTDEPSRASPAHSPGPEGGCDEPD